MVNKKTVPTRFYTYVNINALQQLSHEAFLSD